MHNDKKNKFRNKVLSKVPQLLNDVEREHSNSLLRLGIKEPRCYYLNSLFQLTCQEITKDYWELQNSPLGENMPIAAPQKITKRKLVWTGSKKDKLKSIEISVDIPQVSYAIHALKQYRVRTKGKSINLDSFHDTNKDWINAAIVLDDPEGKELTVEDAAMQMTKCRKNSGKMIIPFGTGAFIGDVARYRNEAMDIKIKIHKGKNYPEVSESDMNPHFIAVTFVTYDMLFPSQRETLHLIETGDYQGAIDNIKATHKQKK